MPPSEDGEAAYREYQYGQELLPGLPDHLTVQHISTKVVWQSLHVLSCVSRDWYHAIRTREIHRARVFTNSTEEFALVYDESKDDCGHRFCLRSGVCLYSMRHDVCLELPRPPVLGKVVALDGRLYVVGGLDYGICPHHRRLLDLTGVFRQLEIDYEICPHHRRQHDVYVLDLTGALRQWKSCSNMNQRRSGFGCGVLHGKIYVFGGVSWDSSSGPAGSEVYDPQKDIWSPISPMISSRCNHNVETVGDEFFVHGGVHRAQYPGGFNHNNPGAHFYEVYNPSKDEWRLVRPDSDRILFTAGGVLFSMGRHEIIDVRVHDVVENSRALFQSSNSVTVGVFAPHDLGIRPCTVLALENELLAIVADSELRYHLFKSRGFNDQSGKIVWEKIHLRSPYSSWRDVFGRIRL